MDVHDTASVLEPSPGGSIPANLPSAIPLARTQDLLSLVRAVNEEVFLNLQSFVCDEEIHRFKGRLSGESARHIDRVTTKVSFENGVEHYTDIRQNGHERAGMSSLAGAWSTGEFGTLLRQTQDLLRTQPVLFRRNTDLDGVAATIYAVEVSEQDSPWDLQIGLRSYRIPFRTEVWVAGASGQMLKIERVSTSIPPPIGISEIRWGVTLQPVSLINRTWLLPRTGDYTVLYEQTGRREWNEMTFSNYRRYGSEVALRFH